MKASVLTLCTPMVVAALLGWSPLLAQTDNRPVVIASKAFTESCILAELMAQMIEAHTDVPVKRKMNLGGTLICATALREGEIDLYPDYTGTGWAIVLKEPGKITDPLRAYLHVKRRYEKEYGIKWLLPFGLNNTYALAMDEEKAEQLGIRRISDLVAIASELTAGFSIEFMNREDGFPGLTKAYGLEFGQARGLEHGLAYAAIESGQLDVIDAYSTDAKLLRYSLRTLEDDRRFFPPYNAAPLIRIATLNQHPELEEVLDRLAFRLSDRAMQHLNFRVEEDGLAFDVAAREFLANEKLLSDQAMAKDSSPSRAEGVRARGFWNLVVSRAPETIRLGWEHIALTLSAVLLASILAIPLGIAIADRPGLGRITLAIAGVLQTIPSLALLAFMIPVLGIDVRAAIAALFLYAILPILRNTQTGIHEVDPDLVDAAKGMGLTKSQILRHVQLPLASRTIMAGIRTSTVISIGVATLAAFIGAGGFGEPIITGLYLNDTNLILTGAIPAAGLAIVADFMLGLLEKKVAPRGG